MVLRLAVTMVLCAAVALPATSSADPDTPAPPPIPDVNAYTPLNPAEYAVLGGTWYAFAGPPGVTCIINRQNGDYGCSGPLPGAPGGANLVSGGQAGAPTFSTTAQPLFSAAGAVKPLPANTRLSFREISCGVDGAGVVACLNAREQVGFVVGSAGSFVSGASPLLDRPEGTPLLPGLPPAFPGIPSG
jgi:hypothetical protein